MRAVSVGRPNEVLALLARSKPELIILDLELDQESGLNLLREIRARSNVPVIITMSRLSKEIDRVVGLESGADDCITKPFGLMELLARIRAILRRSQAGQTLEHGEVEKKGCCQFGDWRLDRRSMRLTNSAGQLMRLTKGEYALLIAFLDAPRRPLSREQLMQATRRHDDVFDRSIDVQILRLRRKLKSRPGAPSIIQTIRGLGYSLSVPVEELK
jgi:DNA-binding response OmpR family regulator